MSNVSLNVNLICNNFTALSKSILFQLLGLKKVFVFRFPRSVTPPRPWNFLTSQDLNISLELFLLTISR